MPADIFATDNPHDAEHREAYRRQRDMLANATTAYLVGLLDTGTDDDLTRTAARDELWRRGEHVSTA